MPGCTHQKNPISCPCTYPSCSRHGKCCECIAFHRSSGEIPGCFFSPEAERTYDRSLSAMVSDHRE
ncbi:MAG: DUF6485 family protein [Chitinispirillaceae bacterium]